MPLAAIPAIKINLTASQWMIVYTCMATFFFNLPFGYFRAGFRKLSFMWFLMIHIPVPFIVLIRKFEHVRLTWGLAPFLVGSFFLGQFVGKLIYKIHPFKNKSENNTD